MPSKKSNPRKLHPLSIAIIVFAIAAPFFQAYGILRGLNAIEPAPELYNESLFASRTLNLHAVEYYQFLAVSIMFACVNSVPKYIALAFGLDYCARIARIILKQPHIMRRLLAKA
ncbi:MAG: hypothetical protein ABW199_04190 [Caulobacterales bacterium]